MSAQRRYNRLKTYDTAVHISRFDTVTAPGKGMFRVDAVRARAWVVVLPGMKLIDANEKNLDALAGKTAAVVGYGNQGRAHALNLRDSGLKVLAAQRPGGRGHRWATEDEFDIVPVEQAAKTADLLIMGLPDESASDVYRADIQPHLRPGQTLGFIHGFNIRFGFITPPDGVNCVMVAPKGPGTLVRSLFEEGKGLPALLAVERDATGDALAVALAWAAGIGATRSGVIETTFAAETEADLFGEQVILCGGVTSLMKAAFETLTEAGFAPELAYIECIHELKQIVDLIYTQGMADMRERISNTAAYGDVSRGPRIVDERVRASMKEILSEIQSGAFADEWIAEHRAGARKFRTLLDQDTNTPLESAGASVRKLMPWLKKA